MRGKLTLLAGVCASAIAFPAFAQSADDTSSTEIIVTAQRSNQRLEASRVFRRLLFVRRSCDERYKEQVFA